MNIHFPQNDIARAEAMYIARTDQQYLLPTDGGVLRGLIQDHVCASVDMTSRDTLFSKEDYMQLVYIALRPEGFNSVKGAAGSQGNIEDDFVIGKVITLEPSIVQPRKFWTGKQVVLIKILSMIC